MGDKDREKEPEKEEELKENEDGTLSVAVDTPPEEAEEAEEAEEETPEAPKEEPKEEPKIDAEEEKRRAAQAFYNLRNEIKRKDAEIAELRGKKPSTKTLEELEAELAKQPVSTIQEIVDARVAAALEQDRTARTYTETFAKTLETSKSKVIKKHPELEDNNSVKSQLMMEVLNNHPDLTTNPHGPVLAMVEMENLLRERGLDKASATPTKIPVSAMPSGRNIPRNTKTITLTKEQLQFCKENNIDPKLYAQNMRFSSGVEV